MYTQYKDHLTWIQKINYEKRDNLRFKHRTNFYDMQKREKYLNQ